MHPLRFPNSGTRAKVFIRKIDFKLRVMRSNRVESFYAFLLHFRSEGSEKEGQPSMARPSTKGASHDRLRPGPLQGEATRWGSSRPQASAVAMLPARGARPWARPTVANP
ncbi:hypothetical protein B296_00031286 [Ensete ventricosum]|uniref:Uncharacterized protein n=1 Tax=Ensete ventricosum TaxID=4639 RepID=A0A426YE37_ENSVE|nr:hypothetical protein B296_00031286 [Ensete ventricosum]